MADDEETRRYWRTAGAVGLLSVAVALGVGIYNHPPSGDSAASGSHGTDGGVTASPTVGAAATVGSQDDFVAALPSRLRNSTGCRPGSEPPATLCVIQTTPDTDRLFTQAYPRIRVFAGHLLPNQPPLQADDCGGGKASARGTDAETCFNAAEKQLRYYNRRTGLSLLIGDFDNESNGLAYLTWSGL
ncbi:hypothetical protein NWFMUON74_39500 [Nocardia wallacei]|uniref:Uncharacterized protein n=1 Tax=Nocardia wallacei TaxID=480035 RepID=A0A7G1KLZ3_9NOCA|nr:hypothetical protein NWFMUON74_39500 [Nocardia wallacei]